MSVYGYIRVSSKDQKENRQQIALKEVGVNLQNIYVIYSVAFLNIMPISHPREK